METSLVLDFDLADRLRKALRHSGVGIGEMAEYLGVERNTVGRYVNGHTVPDLRTIRLWAIRTGYPLEWLVNEERARLGSNQRPTVYKVAGERVTAAEVGASLIPFPRKGNDNHRAEPSELTA